MAKQTIVIQRIPLGPMGNLAYLVGDKSSKKATVIDPAWDIPHILQEAQKHSWEITCGLLTHGHYDHADGANALAGQLNIPIYISEKEISLYRPDCPLLKTTKDRQKIMVGDLAIECLHTPGHSPGCQCFLLSGHLFSGDTLFVNACGRCDLPGGNPQQMYRTLYHVLGQLPDETVLYPGHAYGARLSSTLGQERTTNPYLTCIDENDFLTTRMGF